MVNFLIILFGVTMLYVSATSRLEAYIKVLSVQGIILFFIAFFDFSHMHKINAIFLAVETLGFKAILIPWFLIMVVRRNGIFREVEPYISNFSSIVISTMIFSFGFFLSYWSNRMGQEIKPLYFGISVSVMITGLFLIMSRKKIITHVMGYMMLENGIFLLSLSVAKEMPLIVNLGVLLDVFVGVFLLGVFVNRVQSAFDEMHIDALSELKD